MEVNSLSETIWTIDNFISKEECRHLIEISESIGYQEAEVSLPGGAQMMKGLRNNYRLIYEDADLAYKYWQVLKDCCSPSLDGSVAVGLNEQFRFYKYESEQRFKRHIDGRFKRNESEESRITFMIYLNDGFEGGETTFDSIDVEPKAGKALCFIHEQKHEGRPVTNGVKYVLRSDVMYRT